MKIKEKTTLELALRHKYGTTSTLVFSKKAGLVVAGRNLNLELSILIYSRKLITLKSDGHKDNKQSVSSIIEAAHHLTGQSLFCNIDRSSVYHCLYMADQGPIEMLAFHFASSSFAGLGEAQGLSRSLSAISSFILKYWYPVSKRDQGAQFVKLSEKKFEQSTSNLQLLPKRRVPNSKSKLSIASKRSWFPWTDHHTKQQLIRKKKNNKSTNFLVP